MKHGILISDHEKAGGGGARRRNAAAVSAAALPAGTDSGSAADGLGGAFARGQVIRAEQTAPSALDFNRVG